MADGGGALMRIGFVSPRSSFCSNDDRLRTLYERSGFVRPYSYVWSGLGTGLLTLAALTPEEHTVDLIDDNLQPIDFSADYDLVAITAMTQQATRGYSIAAEFRRRGIPVVMGGLHVTSLPEEAARFADHVIVGEAEYSWPEFLDDFQNGNAKSIYTCDRTVDLRDSPVPRFDLLIHQQPSVAWIQATRGCPHDCEFCSATRVFGQAYRHKSVDQFVNEVVAVQESCGSILIAIADDNAFVDPRFSEHLLTEMIPLKVRWMAQTDVSVARHDKLLDLASRSGCSHLFIGFESLRQDSLRGLDASNWKLRQLPNYRNVIKKIQSYGIGVMGSFIVGLDSDDLDTFKEIEDFVIENDLFDAHITILTPGPGTRLRRRLEDEGRLLPTPWSNYTGWDVNFVHPTLTSEQILDGVHRIYERINDPLVLERRYRFYKNMVRQRNATQV